MGSITGLKKGAFTSIDNSGEFRLDTNLDPGTAGEVIVSGGPNQPATWGPNGVAVPNALTAGTNITYTSGAASWDGSVADTINATDTDTTYTAGSGMDLTGTTFSTDNDGTTINNSGGTGTQNQVLKVPNTLTINGTSYDGSVARNFTLAAAPIPNADLQNSSITLGSTSISLGATATTIDDLELDSCQGITMDGGNIDCDCNDVDNVKDLTYCSGGSALTGGGGAGDETVATYLDLTSSTNLFPPNIPVLPPNVFEVSPSVYHMAFSQGIWMPNDDSSYFNYAIEDDFTAPLVAGRGKILSSSLEVSGFLNIPNGWRATGIYIDVRGSTGYQVSRSIVMYSVKTYSTSNPISSTYTYLGGSTTNTAYTLFATMDGAIDRVMWVEVSLTSTADYIAGGYIVLTKI